MTSEFNGYDDASPSKKAFWPKLHVCSLKTYTVVFGWNFSLSQTIKQCALGLRISLSCGFRGLVPQRILLVT